MRILFLEDHEIVRLRVADELTRAGHVVQHTGYRDAAQRVLAHQSEESELSERIQVFLTDYDLSITRGGNAVDLVVLAVEQHIPHIIAFSSMWDYNQRLRVAGATAAFEKTSDLQPLLEYLKGLENAQ